MLSLLALTACMGSDALDITDPQYLAEVTGEPLPLDERVELSGLGLHIGYPEGWYAESGGPFTSIAPDRGVVIGWFAGEDLEGPLIFFELETFGFMQGMGLTVSNPTPEDILVFSSRTFGWEEVRDQEPMTLFGGEGIGLRGRDPRGEFLGIVGVLPEERAILVMVIAPTAPALEQMLVTWRAMSRSIGPGAESVTAIGVHPSTAAAHPWFAR